ncbi:MAG: hypothetical protein NTY91_01590 [Euryarchaeota archaeon]|nr:hypothetical protein [Euryarchaeota archaeon]
MIPQELSKGGVPILKERGRKKNILKNISTLVIVCVLICCSFSALANIATDKPTQNIQIAKSSSFEPKGNISILAENFSDGSMPPLGWIHDKINPSGTWKIDSTRSHSPPNSASVWRGPNCHGLQNEWLITPGLNFSEYVNPSHTNKITLDFWWYTDIYVVQNSLIYFNVSISTNGGINWTKIWIAKDQSGFPQYQFTHVGMPIDLSEYRNESNVTIGFQFYSNTEEEDEAQYFAIDDIFVLTEGPVNFSCDAGGPYEWYFYRQGDYIPAGVRFHGNVTGFNALSCSWLWDFGNGNTSIVPRYTWNYYNKTGYYNVTLRVIHGRNVTNDTATVHIFLMAPPDIDITLKKFSIPGIQAVINNPGDYNATNVNWSMKVFLGPLKMREKIVANDTINIIGAHSTTQIASKYFFGFRLIRIEIAAMPENIYGVNKGFYAIKIGPLILALSSFIPEKI